MHFLFVVSLIVQCRPIVATYYFEYNPTEYGIIHQNIDFLGFHFHILYLGILSH